MNKYFIETFGCQMNKYDSELVASILENEGYAQAVTVEDANLILMNTCSVRDHAEMRVRNKLDSLQGLKRKNKKLIVGVLGCMAQRLGASLIEDKPLVDFVSGPDGYRNLPDILEQIISNNEFTELATQNDSETYSDIYPSRIQGISAWVAIMRGCNNFCSYCIVPYVRGRERSRTVKSILNEVRQLVTDGFSEVTLLGQNVNSYRDEQYDFADLLKLVSRVDGLKRVRFATSHPKDLSDKLIETIGENDKICNHIHLAVQSGSNRILNMMNRHYTREHFISLIEKSRLFIDNPGIYTDIIVGFPGETKQDFQDTLDLVLEVQFDNAFTFKYSPREGTSAYKLTETVSGVQKQERLVKLIELQKRITLAKNRKLIGSVQTVLVEGPDKKETPDHLMGRTGTNKIVVFKEGNSSINTGSFVDVKITTAEGQTLFGEIYQSK